MSHRTPHRDWMPYCGATPAGTAPRAVMGVGGMLGVAAGLLALTGIVRADPPATGPGTASSDPSIVERTPGASANVAGVSAEVVAAVAALSAEDWASRESAQGRLIALGERSRSAAEALAGSPDADEESRSRALAVLAALDREKRLGPTRVTLDLRDVPAVDALDRLAAAAGVTFHYYDGERPKSEDAPRVTYAAEYVPFWQAFDEFARHAQIKLWDFGMDLGVAGPNGIALTPHPDLWPPRTHYAGPARVSLLRIGRDRSDSVYFVRDVAGGLTERRSVRDQVRFHLSLLLEPKATLPDGRCKLRLTTVLDAEGNPLDVNALNVAEESRHEVAVIQSGGSASIDLSFPAEHFASTRRLQLLRGTLSFPVVTEWRSSEVEVDLNATGSAILAAGPYTLTLEGAQFTDPYVRLSFTIEKGRDALTTLYDAENVQLYSDERFEDRLPQHLRLVDASGVRLHVRNVRVERDRDRENRHIGTLTCEIYRGRQGGEDAEGPLKSPLKAYWTVPTQAEVIEIPFEFRDVPLP